MEERKPDIKKGILHRVQVLYVLFFIIGLMIVGKILYLQYACRNIALAELPVLEPCRRAIMNGETVEIEDLKKWRDGMAKARANSKIR